MLNKTLAIILLVVVILGSTCGDTFQECEGKFETYVALEDDCSFYIFCHGEDSFSDSCPEDSPYFSIDEQTCDSDRNVCKDRPIFIDYSDLTTVKQENSPNVPTIAPISSTTISTTRVPVPPTVSTSLATRSTVSTTTTYITLPQTISTTFSSTQATSIPLSCPVVDNPNNAIFLPHSKSCSDYFLCYKGQGLPMHCSYMLHFDVRQQRCDYPQNVNCQMMNVASPREQCLPHTFDYYPHPKNCNYYYQCILGYLKVMQCPLNMGWHYEMRACVMISHAKCYNYFF